MRRLAAILFASATLASAVTVSRASSELQAKLLAPDGGPADDFGWDLALDGDTALVGVPRDDDNGPTSGSAYVYLLSGDDPVPAVGVFGALALFLALLGVATRLA